MMKTFLYPFLSLVLICCKQAEIKPALKEFNSSDKIFSDTDSIFGSWTMCAIASNGQMIQMNTCPIVTFKKDGVGYVSNNAFVSNTFQWRLRNFGMKII